MDRGERRFRTARKAQRQLVLRVKFHWPTQHKAGYFKKRKALGCRCRKHGRGCSPKVVASMCHHHDGGYHPSVLARIESKRVLVLEFEQYLTDS